MPPVATLDPSAGRPARALAWAAYLGASWTWVIGMYLPVLLVRDLGLAGYLVFAVPNVVGAAAMGWVLTSPESSRRLVREHAGACALFSIVTLSFHAYWLVWLGGWSIRALDAGLPGMIGIVTLVVGVMLGSKAVRSDALARIGGLVAMTVSLVAMAVFLLAPEPATPAIAERLTEVPFSSDALWMMSVSTLGFLLCPYLDLTFNRARQACPTANSGRLAFTVGFGVCFCLMIVFTLLYAGPMVGFVNGSPVGQLDAAIPVLVAVAIGAHVAVQWVFTASIHRREAEDDRSPMRRLAPLGIPVACVLGLIAVLLAEHRPLGMAPGEIGYRGYLSFYGLIFPAYVWLNMVDVRTRSLRAPTARSINVTLLVILLAMPFYALGFLWRIEPWLVPGVAIVLLAKLFTGQAPGLAAGASRPRHA
ncbi:MAG: hypothetical protein AAGF47_03260 [Planctomycetota bacterium]